MDKVGRQDPQRIDRARLGRSGYMGMEGREAHASIASVGLIAS